MRGRTHYSTWIDLIKKTPDKGALLYSLAVSDQGVDLGGHDGIVALHDVSVKA